MKLNKNVTVNRGKRGNNIFWGSVKDEIVMSSINSIQRGDSSGVVGTQ